MNLYLVTGSMSVCLSAHISQKLHIQISPNFLYMLTMAMAWSFSDSSIILLCTSGFVDDLMFLRSRVNGPEPEMTRIFQ